jgi:hypothetical protein
VEAQLPQRDGGDLVIRHHRPRKLEVLAHHQSQAERSYLEAEAVTSTVRYWTRQLAGQARYAEPFELVSALTHISDTSIV